MELNSTRQEPLRYPAADESAKSNTPPPGARALFVVHGMGQQMRFETIDGVLEGMRAHDVTIEKSTGRTVQLDDLDPVQRTEIEYTTKSDPARRTLHVYEAYWAPLTEGEVSARDVLLFLFSAAWNGMKKGSPFRRWIFQEPHDYPISRMTTVHLAFAALTVAALALLNFVIAAVVVARTWTQKDTPLLNDLETIAVFVLLNLLFCGILLLLAKFVRMNVVSSAGFIAIFGTLATIIAAAWFFGIAITHHTHQKPLPFDGWWIFSGLILCVAGIVIAINWPRTRSWSPYATLTGAVLIGASFFKWTLDWFCSHVKEDFWGFLFLTIHRRESLQWLTGAVAVFVVAVIAYMIFRAKGSWFPLLLAMILGIVSSPAVVFFLFNWMYGAVRRPQILPASTAFPLLFGVSWLIKNFLIQFVGDVAAYVSSYRLDRFFKLRKEIQDSAAKVTRTIYGLTDPNNAPLYESVAFVGHSLGSVIAYDTLNRMLIEEDLHSKVAIQVRDRTRLLLTFGSPLNKIAYLFSALSDAKNDFREQLASAVQPLIDDAKAREKLTWINVWSPNDIISGHLDYFDLPASPNPVRNQIDDQAVVPVFAHTSYWKNKQMYLAITNWLQ